MWIILTSSISGSIVDSLFNIFVEAIEWYENYLVKIDHEVEQFICNERYSHLPELKRKIKDKKDLTGKLSDTMFCILKLYQNRITDLNKKYPWFKEAYRIEDLNRLDKEINFSKFKC